MLSLTICLIDLICPIQGDPFVSCRPFTPEDLCRPNPCGANAYCESAFPVDKVEILHQEVNNFYKTVFFSQKVNLALTTGLAKIDQCAFATKDTEVRKTLDPAY